MKYLTITLGLILSTSLFAKEAEVIMLRGKVTSSLKNKKDALKKGSKVSEGSTITTEKASVARIKLVDGSVITVGPKSSVKVKKISKKGAGVLTLLKGKIRAKVEKKGDGKKDKLYIVTKTAAMGVRGTELQATYNPKNRISGLLTFKGDVALKKLTGPIQSIQALRQTLQTKDVVRVKKGQFSRADDKKDRAVIPVRIAPLQFAGLRKNESFVNEINDGSQGGPDGSPRPRNAPPKKTHRIAGIPDSVVDNDHSFLKDELIKQNLFQKREIEAFEAEFNRPPENEPDFDIMPGGMITENGHYVAPIPGQSKFDPIAKVYVPDESLGGIDFRTGEYRPPEGYELTDNGEFQHKDPNYQPPKDEFYREPTLYEGNFSPDEFEKLAYNQPGEFDPNFDPSFFEKVEKTTEDARDEVKDSTSGANQPPPPTGVVFKVIIQ